MRSVPPRGSNCGSSDCRLPISDCRLIDRYRPIGNQQSTIGNHKTHPLPRGGTDLMGPLAFISPTEIAKRPESIAVDLRRLSRQTFQFNCRLSRVLIWYHGAADAATKKSWLQRSRMFIDPTLNPRTCAPAG